MFKRQIYICEGHKNALLFTQNLFENQKYSCIFAELSKNTKNA